jgi:hypothetical protein
MKKRDAERKEEDAYLKAGLPRHKRGSDKAIIVGNVILLHYRE